MGTETLTLRAVEEERDRVRDELESSGIAHLSLDYLGERSLCKNIIKSATSHLKASDFSASFDGDANEFVVRMENMDDEEPADDTSTEDAADDDADGEGVPF